MKEPQPGDVIYIGQTDKYQLIFDYIENHEMYGHVRNPEGHEYEPIKVGSILARGYWEPAPGFRRPTSRYFFKVRNETEILSVYRLVEDEDEAKVFELIWVDGKWEVTDTLIRMLINGEMDLEEVELDIVEMATPHIDTSEYRAN